MASLAHYHPYPYPLFVTFGVSRQQRCDRSTRQDRHFRSPFTRTAAGQRSFLYRATSLLNELPPAVIELDPARFSVTLSRSVIGTPRGDRPKICVKVVNDVSVCFFYAHLPTYRIVFTS